jgi:hypothetical protein
MLQYTHGIAKYSETDNRYNKISVTVTGNFYTDGAFLQYNLPRCNCFAHWEKGWDAS